MKHMKRYLCLALLMLAAASAVASEIALDLRPRAVRTRGVAVSRATQTEEEAGTLRQTVLDAGAASTGSLAVGDVLRLSVYDDVTLSLTLVAREEAPLARASFQAEVSGANWRDAVVTETDAGLLVTATDPASGLVYAVVSSDDRVTVREIDPHALPVVDGGVRVPELDAVRDGVPTKRSAASTDQASTVVDMLVAYDRPAAAWAKANGGGVTNLAQQCVARMNGALANNGLDAAFRFRLVGVMAVDADGDGSLNDTLNKVTQKTGAWAAVSAMRDAVGADVVSTMVDTGSAYGTTGLGWSLTQTTESGMRNFSEHAYNVLSVRAAAQSHVMAHETGHNMGAGHADAQTSSPGLSRSSIRAASISRERTSAPTIRSWPTTMTATATATIRRRSSPTPTTPGPASRRATQRMTMRRSWRGRMRRSRSSGRRKSPSPTTCSSRQRAAPSSPIPSR